MKKRVVTAALVSVGGAAGLLAWRRKGRTDAYASAPDGESRARWRAVTIFAGPDEVMPEGRVPAPLARLGDLVEVEVSVAPGGKGSELRARLRTPKPEQSAAGRLSGEDPRQQVRAALREAKQLIEVGEVLRVDPVSHGRRTPTPTGWLVELATKRAPGEGVL